MQEFESESSETMQGAAVRQSEYEFRTSFALERRLPEPIAALERIAENFFWSWNPAGIELFRDLDPQLWLQVEQSPKKLLNTVSDLRLWQQAANTDYVAKVARFTELFDGYMSEGSPYTNTDKPNTAEPIAYFCAEYGVHNSLPNYSGGLGILAGDHLKSASDLNMPLLAVGLLYRFGYFRQNIGHDGLQEEHYNDLFNCDLAVTPALDSSGDRIKVMVHIRGREVHAQAWLAQVGRIPLYLLDTNLPENNEVDRLITGHLYGGDSETRIVQEKVLGIGGVRLVRRLGLRPSVFHLNEGHSSFLTLELAREHIAEHPDASFPEAQDAVRRQCVFTTHTPVAAGNDVFSPSMLEDCFDENYLRSIKLTPEEFYALGRIDPADDSEPFGVTPFALRMSRSANGVSEKHGEVSRDLWREMYSDGAEVPITHVTNGVHAPTWISPIFQSLYSEKIGSDWHRLHHDPEKWRSAVEKLSDNDIWQAHQTLKNLLIAFIRERTRRKDTGVHDTINERLETSGLFSPDVLTIGFARRVAQYKRWNLILSDLDRLLKLVDHAERPVQFVFAGKAHPQDLTAKAILQQLMSINHDSNWQRRAVFIEDYDQEVARYLVHGVDVWMNVPRRPHEASGTSGMKAAMNGALNFSVLDGWWIEGYNGRNGFAVGDLEPFDSDAEIDAKEAEALYSTLENELVPAYYSGNGGLPTEWISRMRDSLATLTPQFSTDRMLMDYLTKIYRMA
jgi:glycogen phosphorylase